MSYHSRRDTVPVLGGIFTALHLEEVGPKGRRTYTKGLDDALIHQASEFIGHAKYRTKLRQYNTLKAAAEQPVLMYTKGYYSYACNTLDNFIEDYCRLPPQDRCYSEMLSICATKAMPCRLYFDLEFYVEDIAGGRSRMYDAIQTLHAFVRRATNEAAAASDSGLTMVGDPEEYVRRTRRRGAVPQGP